MSMNAYYVPPHLAAPFSETELERYISVFREADGDDGDPDGFIGYADDSGAIKALFDSVGETHTVAKEEELLSKCDPSSTTNIAFLDVLRVLAAFRKRRDPFGGKRCISDELPLPMRVETQYDLPCMQHPARAKLLHDPTDPAVTVLKMVFNRWDRDGSGQIDVEEVAELLKESGVEKDSEELVACFNRFDVDHRSVFCSCDLIISITPTMLQFKWRFIVYGVFRTIEGSEVRFICGELSRKDIRTPTCVSSTVHREAALRAKNQFRY